ncbi:hypothetical protein GCM10009557_84620 [Virgisporangium ochraceum]|uniref:Uncharacterized protein n=1 Tax=Virgisporangium ochraceum TaxID=65505 RepID=A0A8J4A0L6_9ACTN|nr:hypothetical protein [Virgisporangium ochraceum]GIJ70910.1 hypothetical protein Voc01_058270 [Virgisporangium ochraceum]
MDVIAQWVRTSWTKASRGGAAAARRNAVPVGFPVPRGPLPLWHEVLLDEATGFAPRETCASALPDRGRVTLAEVDGRLRVRLTPATFGMPDRRRRPPAVWLRAGEWVRWHINYRFSMPVALGGAWSYRLDTLNLAYGPAGPDLFAGTPTRLVDERTALR